MKKADFLQFLTARASEVQHGLNTNNAWGFGGASDKSVYSIGKYTVVTGVACYRHMPSERFVSLREGNKIIVDGSQCSHTYDAVANYIREIAP